MSVFKKINKLPPDSLFGLKARMSADTRKFKVDLGIGAYRDNSGKPWILPSIKSAEKKLQEDPTFNHEYLPIAGNPKFVDAALQVLVSDDAVYRQIKDRTVSAQTLSGTGALHFAGTFLSRFINKAPEDKIIYVSDPTWANHKQIFELLGFQVKTYPYWNPSTKSLNINEMLQTINNASSGSIFLLHAVAHNPTGLDPTKEQWNLILDAIKSKQHFPLFDIAYQGFASGSLVEDSYSLRLGIQKLSNSPIMICQSFAKNLGLYGERVGAVHLILPEIFSKHPAATAVKTNVAPDAEEDPEEFKEAVASQFKKITRSELSNPPAYGSKVAAEVLTDPQLRAQWEQDLKTMSSRIYSMRVALRDALTNKYKTPGNWDHIVKQIGMFSFTGLSKQEVQRLEEKHGVYLTSTGRASVAGLNENNVDFTAQAIDEVVRYSLNQKL
ncbi:aspartate transaminase [Saccharomycopsis crataegensis]|uniref:Aspartate aminotransferase n=1 Tax=Saccharomycopsis crataegensis TaxID=43959 RepID=A0AAV5QG58_9ASCO|nr:aspartate transaminase [Saccharomycopsis crataegensis]